MTELPDLTALRALANAATPEPWWQGRSRPWRVYAENGLVAVPNGVMHTDAEVNAAYIAAAHPEAITALLDEIGRLRAEVARLSEADYLHKGRDN